MQVPERLLEMDTEDPVLYLAPYAVPPVIQHMKLAERRLLEGVELMLPFTSHGRGVIQYYHGQIWFRMTKVIRALFEEWQSRMEQEDPWTALKSALYEHPVNFWPVPSEWWQEDLVDGIGVIIPCYNHEEFLPEAVASALDGGADQVIVVDDGSPGDVIAALKEFRTDPVYVIQQGNQGLPTARNTGIAAATVNRIVSLDADDKVDSNVLKSMRAALDEWEWAYSDVYLFGKTHKRVKVHVNSSSMKSMQPAHPAVMFWKWDWRLAGGYDPTIRGFESWDFHARLIQAGVKPVKADEGLIWYRKHEAGTSMLSRVLGDKQLYLDALASRSPAYFGDSLRKERTGRK
jgi:hypothetical protein